MAIVFANRSFRLVRGTRWDDDTILQDEDTGAAIDLSGIADMVMRIRAGVNSVALLELSITNGLLVIVDAAAGRFGIRVNSETTHSLPAANNARAKYLYDVVIERTSGEYEAAIRGKVTVLPQITRPLDDA